MPSNIRCWVFLDFHLPLITLPLFDIKPTLFETSGTNEGVNLNVINEEGEDDLPILMVTQTSSNTIQIDFHGGADDSYPPKPWTLPASSFPVGYSGSTTRSFVYRVIGVTTRLVQAPSLASMVVDVVMSSFSGAKSFQIDQDSVVPSGAVGVSLVKCQQLMLTESTGLPVVLWGAPCQALLLSTTETAVFSFFGTPDQYGSESIHLAGPAAYNVTIGANSTVFEVTLRAVMTNALSLLYDSDPLDQTLLAHATEDTNFTFHIITGRVWAGGGSGSSHFKITDLKQITGQLTLAGSPVGNCRLQLALETGMDGLAFTITPSTLAANMSSTMFLVSATNIPEKTFLIYGLAGEMTNTTIVTPEAGSSTFVRHIGMPGSVMNGRLTGCVDPTAQTQFLLSGGGSHTIYFGNGRLQNFNCFVRVMGLSENADAQQNETLVLAAGSESSDLIWILENNAITVHDPSFGIFLSVTHFYLSRVVIESGQGKNTVRFQSTQGSTPILLNFNANSSSTVFLSSSAAPVIITGPHTVVLGCNDAREGAPPFELSQAPVYSFSPLQVLVQADTCLAQLTPSRLVLNGPCISPASFSDENIARTVPLPPLDESLAWFRSELAVQGLDLASVNLATCWFGHTGHLHETVLRLGMASDSIFGHGIEGRWTLDFGNGANLFNVTDSNADSVYVQMGNDTDVVSLSNISAAVVLSSGGGYNDFAVVEATGSLTIWGSYGADHGVVASSTTGPGLKLNAKAALGGLNLTVVAPLLSSALDFGHGIENTLIVYMDQETPSFNTTSIGPLGPGPQDYLQLFNYSSQDFVQIKRGRPFVTAAPFWSPARQQRRRTAQTNVALPLLALDRPRQVQEGFKLPPETKIGRAHV